MSTDGSLGPGRDVHPQAPSKEEKLIQDTLELPLTQHEDSTSDDEDRNLTTQKEIFAYYSYYVGNNGIGLFNFAPSQYQNLLSEAADPVTGLLPFLGLDRSINSVLLLSNGISFAIQVAIFLIFGSFADVGSFRPYILMGCSVVAFAVGFAWLGVADPSRWQAATGLYMLGLICYQVCLTFWAAAFPGLARNTPEIRQKARELAKGDITLDDYNLEDSLMQSRISNMALCVQSVCELAILAVIVGILFAINVNKSTEQNTWGLSVTIAFATAVWLVVSIPWFVLEKHRPGLDPGRRGIILTGLWQLYNACRSVWKLKQSLFYLIGHAGYFLLGDSLNTTVTVVASLQSQTVSYSNLDLTYLLLVGIAAQAVGIYAFWQIQKRARLPPKVMFNTVAFFIVLLDGWGMIGNWTLGFGFHNKWEFYFYQAYYGCVVCPWYSLSFLMTSEVSPRGHEYLFFSLFSIMGKTSSFIGPIISSAIIDADPSHNASTPFYFLFGLSLASFIFLVFFVDIKKSKQEQLIFLEDEAREMAKHSSC